MKKLTNIIVVLIVSITILINIMPINAMGTSKINYEQGSGEVGERTGLVDSVGSGVTTSSSTVTVPTGIQLQSQYIDENSIIGIGNQWIYPMYKGHETGAQNVKSLTSSDESVIRIMNNAFLEGLKSGSSTIRCVLENGDSFESVVMVKEVIEFKILELPTKMEYEVGDNPELIGIKLYAKYKDGSELILENDDKHNFHLYGFDIKYPNFNINYVGKQKVVINYYGFSEEFEINILPETSTEISGTINVTSTLNNTKVLIYPIETTNEEIKNDIKLETSLLGESFESTIEDPVNNTQTYNLSNVPADKYKLVTYKPGFVIDIKEVSTTEGDSNINVDLKMVGDINGTNTVTITDLILMRKHILKSKLLNEEEIEIADININGTVTISDLIQLRQRILKRRDETYTLIN